MDAIYMINTFNAHEILNEKLDVKEREEMIRGIRSLLHPTSLILWDMSLKYMHPATIEVDYSGFQEVATFNGFRPKTKTLYGNYIELELLRILYKLDPTVSKAVYELTKKRIKTTCYGKFCPKGECFEISVMVLRFISVVFPEESEWIDLLMFNISQTIVSGDKKIAYQTKLYYVWTLYEMNTEKSYKALLELFEWLETVERRVINSITEVDQINKSIVYHSIKKCTPMQCRLA